MHFFTAQTLDTALEIKERFPQAVPIADGTDLMVELNSGRRKPLALLDLSRVSDLRHWHRVDNTVFVGAGVTFSRLIAELADCTPLVQAARTIGSPQIRIRATIGGNLGTASPAGDVLPVLAAYDAEVLVASRSAGTRSVPVLQFLIGPKRTALKPGELILGVRLQIPRGSGLFAKIGPRSAMVIAVVNLCLVLDEEHRAIRVALGSVGPTVLRVRAAEAFIADALDRAGVWDTAAPLPRADLEIFAEWVAAAARPIDDVRGTAAYRRHACGVLARRALARALEGRRCKSGCV